MVVVSDRFLSIFADRTRRTSRYLQTEFRNSVVRNPKSSTKSYTWWDEKTRLLHVALVSPSDIIPGIFPGILRLCMPLHAVRNAVRCRCTREINWRAIQITLIL